ncbi:LysR family transcriptional regulator [Kaarinaea lacus]
MDLNQLAVFEKVAKNQSFTKAALELGMEKSTVSMKVSQLENRLGVRLLNRSTRSVSLTEAGEGYYQYCRQIIEAAKEADQYTQTLSAEPQGTLRITAPMDFGYLILKTLIEPFLKSYPKVNIDLNLSNEIVDLVRERVDVALRPSVTALEDSSLIAKQLLNTRFGFYASPEFLKQQGEPSSLQQLQQLDFVVFAFGVDAVINLSKGDSKYQFQPKGRLTVNDFVACKEAAVAGLGVAILGDVFVKEEISNQRLVRILNDYELPQATLFALYPSRQWLPAKIKVFLDYLEDWGQSQNSFYEPAKF